MTDALDSDETLMLRYAAGDVRAFEILYRRHELKLWRFICRSIGNKAIADELMQDVWFPSYRLPQAINRWRDSQLGHSLWRTIV
jgi:DNA-directed RNA polymerase specialized sigma24 family protein